MAFPGAFRVVNATVRPNVGTGGKNTPKPFPYSTTALIKRTRSMMVTAAAGNAGTIYVAFNLGPGDSNATRAQTVATATGRERTFLKLAAGQSYTFNGMNLGSAADRDIVFGTGYSYIHASATPNNLAICSWLEQD